MKRIMGRNDVIRYLSLSLYLLCCMESNCVFIFTKYRDIVKYLRTEHCDKTQLFVNKIF